MAKKDNVRGKWFADFYFYDEYGIGSPRVHIPEIAASSPPAFTTERDAIEAETFAETVFLETVRYLRGHDSPTTTYIVDARKRKPN